MKTIHLYSVVLAVATSCLINSTLSAGEPAIAPVPNAVEQSAPRVQLAILLDTSGSMDGLINQARTQLWKIVNELATSKQNGKTPQLQVALYEYGKSSISRDEGYLRQIVPLSDDLDRISEELFALTTNGGQEYCGQVIQAATAGLEWSQTDEDLKLIFIAGNEAFTQGSVNYKDACSAAIAQGITVNTIYCGPEAEGIRTGWQEGAALADGSFLSINQNREVAAIATPFDKKLAELSGQVNRTFVFYGGKNQREKLANRQLAQDKLAAKSAPAAAAERAAFKGKKQYRSNADLVDAVTSGKVNLKDVKDDELPAELKKLEPKQREAFIARKQKERAELQAEIKKLSQQRKAYIAEARRKESEAKAGDSLDEAIIKSVRQQAAKKKFAFEKE